MRGRKKLKQRTLPSKVVKTEDFENKVEKAMREANQRIKSVSKKYKGTTYMWAVNKLQSKLGKRFFKNGRVFIPKQTKRNDLLLIYKEIESFLRSKESTKSGIKAIQEKAKQTIKSELFDGDVTDEDVEGYYRMFEDDDYTAFLKATGLSPSEFWVIIDEAKKAGDSEDSFLSRLEQYITRPDEYVRNLAIRIYNRYVA